MTEEERIARVREIEAGEARARQPIPPVRRGTHKRRAKAGGMHMATFWAMDAADRELTYALSKAGRRR
jgi:hypothetical protein